MGDPVKRGRPLKFGRPADLVTLTLPVDVIDWLESLDDDLAWAVVKIHERETRRAHVRKPELAELVQLPNQRALILVKPAPFERVRGVSIIPLADGRGFLALDAGKGVADLELAVIDRLDEPGLPASERVALNRLRSQLKTWRQDGIQFESRSIIVAKRPAAGTRGRPLSPLREAAERN